MSEINKNNKNKLFEHIKIADKIFSWWDKRGIFAKYDEQPLAWFIGFVGWDILNNDLEDKNTLTREFIDIVEKYNLGAHASELDGLHKRLYKRLLASQ